jgi:hypothetical protein
MKFPTFIKVDVPADGGRSGGLPCELSGELPGAGCGGRLLFCGVLAGGLLGV